jgi:hypothetical protein
MKLKENKNIFCSVSAGYSSVMMAIMLPIWFPDHKIVYAMANTSKERVESLNFMNNCDKHFKFNLKWIESEFHESGTGVSFKIVNFQDLKLKGEIFEQGIKKLGIPNVANKWCNRDLKVTPLKKFADSIFGRNNYSIAVGLRSDEIDRVRKDYKENNIFYPLMDKGINKNDRNYFWKDQPVKISIPAFKGNCDMCFEKSNRKLMTIIKEDKKLIDWWDDMIETYGKKPLTGKPAYNDMMKDNNVMSFYRKYKTIQDLVKLAENPFSKSTDEYVYENDLFDNEDECGSGCSAF